MTRRQRITTNLGFNRSRIKPIIYDYIENVLGIKEKHCSLGTTKYPHKNPLPIRNFNLMGASIDKDGRVIIKSRDGLQPSCIQCERRYRAERIERNKKKFSKMTDEEIYENYRKEYGETKKCSRCKKDKRPEEFPISRGMETGLHNVCKVCSKSYSEAVGSRWAIYSPDGHEVTYITDEDSCKICGSKENLHKDHIIPLALGGTDNKENIQTLCRKHNLSKSDKLIIKSLEDIKKEMICERYWDILDKAKREGWSLDKFELAMRKAVREFILRKMRMSDDELRKFFENEKIKNNRKHSVEHAIKKFRQYCKTEVLEIEKQISESG